jgi:hypothetical protein
VLAWHVVGPRALDGHAFDRESQNVIWPGVHAALQATPV